MFAYAIYRFPALQVYLILNPAFNYSNRIFNAVQYNAQQRTTERSSCKLIAPANVVTQA